MPSATAPSTITARTAELVRHLNVAVSEPYPGRSSHFYHSSLNQRLIYPGCGFLQVFINSSRYEQLQQSVIRSQTRIPGSLAMFVKQWAFAVFFRQRSRVWTCRWLVYSIRWGPNELQSVKLSIPSALVTPSSSSLAVISTDARCMNSIVIFPTWDKATWICFIMSCLRTPPRLSLWFTRPWSERLVSSGQPWFCVVNPSRESVVWASLTIA